MRQYRETERYRTRRSRVILVSHVEKEAMMSFCHLKNEKRFYWWDTITSDKVWWSRAIHENISLYHPISQTWYYTKINTYKTACIANIDFSCWKHFDRSFNRSFSRVVRSVRKGRDHKNRRSRGLEGGQRGTAHKREVVWTLRVSFYVISRNYYGLVDAQCVIHLQLCATASRLF